MKNGVLGVIFVLVHSVIGASQHTQKAELKLGSIVFCKDANQKDTKTLKEQYSFDKENSFSKDELVIVKNVTGNFILAQVVLVDIETRRLALRVCETADDIHIVQMQSVGKMMDVAQG